jgi:hypothetical protein
MKTKINKVLLTDIRKYKINLKKIDTETEYRIKLDNLYYNSDLRGRLIISLKLFLLCRDNLKLMSENIDSIKYITINGYYMKLLKHDKQNSFNEKLGITKPKYCKYTSYKKQELIDKVLLLEKTLWDKNIVIRKMRDKYEGKDIGVVIFE